MQCVKKRRYSKKIVMLSRLLWYKENKTDNFIFRVEIIWPFHTAVQCY